MYQKNGQISGGGSELSKRASRWKDKELETERRALDEKQRTQRELLAARRIAQESLIELTKQVTSLDAQVRHSESALDTASKRLRELENDSLRRDRLAVELKVK